MKAQVKTPVMIVAIIAALGVLGFFGMKTIGSSGSLDNGQVNYTPGKPPWMETGAKTGGPPVSNSPNGAPVIDNRPH